MLALPVPPSFGHSVRQQTRPHRGGERWELCVSALADVLCRVRDQGQVACPLDGLRQAPLVLGAGASSPPRKDASTLVYVPLKRRKILIVDARDLIGAERTDLAPAPVLSPATWAGTCAAATTAARAATAVALARL